MKLTFILLTVAMFSVHASGLSQNITLTVKQAGLEDVFDQVKRRTGYVFFFRKEDLRGTKPVSIKVNNVSIDAFLKQVLLDQPLKFSIKNNAVIISRKETDPAPDAPMPENPPITVSGKIVNEKGEPVLASVVVKGSILGVTTDNQGYYSLNYVNENATLIISGVSIETQEIKVNKRTEINITVKTKIAIEEEVTVSTGYISSTRIKSTANISKVTAAEIERQPVTSPLMALQGRVPGLDISPTSGTAGSAFKVRIRGENTLRGLNTSDLGNNPLYVIDGIPIDSRPLKAKGEMTGNSGIDPLASIGASNIESIEILKDGAATGIYGSRGANGVILITTKKNKNNYAKTNVELNYYTGAGKLAHFVDMLNTSQYLEMRREAIKNAGAVVGDFDFDLNGTWDTTRNVNWQKELLGGSAAINDVQLYVSGGNGQTSFRIGGNIHKETTIYPGDFGYRNVTGTANISHTTPDKKFRLFLNMNYANNLNKIANSATYISNALHLAPNAPQLYDENGKLDWGMTTIFGTTLYNTWSNPMSNLLKMQKVNTQNFFSNVSVEYQLLQNLQFKSNFGFNTLTSNETSTTPIAANPPYAISQYTEGMAIFAINKRISWTVEPQFVYSRNINDHGFKIIAGAAFQQANLGVEATRGEGYKSDLLLNSIKGATRLFSENDVDNQYRYAAVFGAAHYEYQNKYIADVNFRRDGSSRFGPQKQYGNFGGAGIAWIFSNENLFSNTRLLSHGKLRASYAITGNDQIEDYSYYPTYGVSPAPYLTMPALYADALSNKNLGWESIKKLEFGVELGFLNNRFFFELVHYRNRSSNQLISYPLPTTTGFLQVLKNFDALVENSGWEAQFSTKNIVHKNFTWTSSFNISMPKNKLVSFPGIDESSLLQKFQIGSSLNIQYQYQYTGVDPQTGKYTFLDVDKNGRIDAADKIFTYATDKKFYGGLFNSFSYRSFELSFLLQFSRQPGFKDMVGIPGPGFGGNQPVYVMRRWTKPGDITDVQLFSTDYNQYGEFYNAQESDIIRTDASYIRLKTLSLSWALPKRWIKAAKMSNARLFLQGQNIFTITDYEGFDPETGPLALPPIRMITGGFQLNF